MHLLFSLLVFRTEFCVQIVSLSDDAYFTILALFHFA